MDRASQVLAQAVPPGVPNSYRARADHTHVQLLLLAQLKLLLLGLDVVYPRTLLDSIAIPKTAETSLAQEGQPREGASRRRQSYLSLLADRKMQSKQIPNP